MIEIEAPCCGGAVLVDHPLPISFECDACRVVLPVADGTIRAWWMLAPPRRRKTRFEPRSWARAAASELAG